MGQKIEQKSNCWCRNLQVRAWAQKALDLRESPHIVYHIKGLKKEKSHGHINRHRKSIWQNPAPVCDKNLCKRNSMDLEIEQFGFIS